MSRPLKDFFFFFTCLQFSFKNTFTSESTRQTINLSLYMICPSWPYKYKAFEGLYTQNKARHGVVRTVMQARAFSTPLYLVFHMYRDQKKKSISLCTLISSSHITRNCHFKCMTIFTAFIINPFRKINPIFH